MLNFKFKIEEAYFEEFEKMLSSSTYEEDIYNELMDEFMYFCEVSGSGK